MKVINVVQDFNVGGIQKLLLEYLRYFKNNKDIDYSVVVLESSKDSIYDKICKDENLKIHYLNGHNSKNKHYYIRQFVLWNSYDYALYKYLKRQKPDIVHTHNTRIFIRIRWCIKKLYTKYKWFHTLHSDPYAVADAHISIAKAMFENYNIKPICLNKTQFEKARSRYGISKCIFLYNSLDQNLFESNVIPAQAFKKLLNIKDDAFIVGAVGRINPIKNYEFFINIIAGIKEQIPNVIGVIVGDKSDSRSLQSKIEALHLTNNILLTGNRSDVANFYNIFDRFVIVSSSESSSFVLIEAQLFNNVCIASEACPIESFCSENKVVRLSLNDPIEKWVKEIIKPSLFEKQFSKIEEYSINNVVTKMIKVYKKS